jgi:hypothetical protein
MTQRPTPSKTTAHTDAQEKPAGNAPRWVLSGDNPNDLSRGELLARYRRQRGLPEDPFTTPRPAPPPRPRSISRPPPKPPVQFKRVEPAKAPPRKPSLLDGLRGRSLGLGQTFALAAAMALASGAAVGVINAKFSAMETDTTATTASTAPLPVEANAAPLLQPVLKPAEAQPAQESPAQKKRVPTATLQVSNVTGETNSFIPLALRAEPAQSGSDMLLKISGVPEGAYLTSGTRGADKNWALSLQDLGGLKLVVPEADVPAIDLSVAAFEPQTGQLAAPVKTMTVALSNVVVEPAAGPPPNQMTSLPGTAKAGYPAAIPPPRNISLAVASGMASNADQLTGQADSLFRGGDIRAARNAYEKAWEGGSSAGAYGLARSYDPVVLASLAVEGATPDRTLALQWYQRAAASGNAEAAAAIVRLKLKR